MPQNAINNPLSDLTDGLLEIRDTSIDVENVMEDIRRRLEKRREELGYDERKFPRFGSTPYPVKPEKLPANIELQNRLQDVNNMYSLAETEPFLVSSPATQIPILGGLWKRIRRSAHDLVLFYVNRYVAHQTSVNHHLVNGISQLATQSIEQQQQIAALQQELEELRADAFGNQ